MWSVGVCCVECAVCSGVEWYVEGMWSMWRVCCVTCAGRERGRCYSYCSDNEKDGRTDRDGAVGGGGREQGEEERGQ